MAGSTDTLKQVMDMRLLVTRPEPQASAWVANLQAKGFDAQALPLMAISGPTDPAPVVETWRQLHTHRLLMFVSPAAAEWFFRLRPADCRWPATTLAACPGPGTARVLSELGATCGLARETIVCPDVNAEQFDSESLWPLLRPLPWSQQSVRIISGGDAREAQGRNWLADQLTLCGAQVQPLLTYTRGAGTWTPRESALAQAAIQSPDQHLWLFSSSQAIDHLTHTHLPAIAEATDSLWRNASALCTHPRIAESARKLGINHIIQCRPTLDAVVQALRQHSAATPTSP